MVLSGIIIFLGICVLILLIYNLKINKKIHELDNINQKVTNLNVLQDFMATIGNDETVDNKIKKINEILIEKYQIKYSSIVVFDGAEYSIKATNVDEKHWETLKNLQNEEIFQDSITSATPKYITVNNEKEKLPYQKLEFGRAKSAIFFPLYIDNIYIGYWILESGVPHAFDKLDTTILEVVKENILTVIKSVSYQSIVESLERRDLYSELKNVEYLYGNGRKILDRYPTSTICMFSIQNIQEINEKYGRNIGNDTIKLISEYIRDNISDEYLFVRYMGPKFEIVFSGVELDGVTDFLQDLKNETEKIVVTQYEIKKQTINVCPKLNFVVSTYYKGTALESLNKKLEEYLNNSDSEECDINLI